MPHHPRPQLRRHHAVHVIIRMMRKEWNLRSRRSFRVIGRALQGIQAQHGARPTHSSVQGNHIRLILEVEDRAHLTRTMRSFNNRLAKGLNRMMGRTGRMVADRYHMVVLRTPTQTRNAIRYILFNTRKHALEHGAPLPRRLSDPYTAGPAEQVPESMVLQPCPLTAEPRTWLLRVGWRRDRPTNR